MASASRCKGAFQRQKSGYCGDLIVVIRKPQIVLVIIEAPIEPYFRPLLEPFKGALFDPSKEPPYIK